MLLNQINMYSTRLYLILIILLVSAVYYYHGAENYPVSSYGFHDLSHWDFQKDGNVALESDWEIYWNQLLTPEDFQSGNKQPAEKYISLPGYWNHQSLDDKPLSARGVATFRLLIKIPAYQESMALVIREIQSAYKIWVNGNLLLSEGMTGSSTTEEKPFLSYSLGSFRSSGTELEVLMQISNFHNPNGGFIYPLVLGLEDTVKQELNRDWTHIQFIACGLFLMGLFHIGFFFIQARDSSPLYLGMSILLTSVYFMISCYGGWFAQVQVPSVTWSVLMSLELNVLVWIFPFFLKFTESIYGKDFIRQLHQFSVAAATLISMSTLFIEFQYHQIIKQIMFFITIFNLVCILKMSYDACQNKREGSYFILTGILIILASLVHDVLFIFRIIKTEQMLFNALMISTIIVSVGGFKMFLKKGINLAEDTPLEKEIP